MCVCCFVGTCRDRSSEGLLLNREKKLICFEMIAVQGLIMLPFFMLQRDLEMTRRDVHEMIRRDAQACYQACMAARNDHNFCLEYCWEGELT